MSAAPNTTRLTFAAYFAVNVRGDRRLQRLRVFARALRPGRARRCLRDPPPAMMRHFKREVPPEDSELGAGVFWIEFDGEQPTRQVERYGDRWLSSRDDYEPGVGGGLADQRLSEVDLGSEYEISAGEFEAAWEEAGRARP